MTALAIGIHNFPEGLATFASALSDVHVGTLHRRRHRDPQYPGGDRRLGADLLRDREQEQGVRSTRSSRASRSRSAP